MKKLNSPFFTLLYFNRSLCVKLCHKVAELVDSLLHCSTNQGTEHRRNLNINRSNDLCRFLTERSQIDTQIKGYRRSDSIHHDFARSAFSHFEADCAYLLSFYSYGIGVKLHVTNLGAL